MEYLSTEREDTMANAQKAYSLGENSFLQKNKFIIFGALALLAYYMSYKRNIKLREWNNILK
jgi:hypothetical protein